MLEQQGINQQRHGQLYIDGLCRIRNISEQGLMIETRQPVLPGQAVRIALRSGKLLGGTVRWVHEGRAGLAMDLPVQLSTLNEPSLDFDVERRGVAPAFARRARALVAIDHRRLHCELSEISLGHLRLEGLEGLRPNDVANVTVEGLGTMLAKFRPLRGTENDSLLALFTQPLHYRLLEEWLEAQAETASLLPHPAALSHHSGVARPGI